MKLIRNKRIAQVTTQMSGGMEKAMVVTEHRGIPQLLCCPKCAYKEFVYISDRTKRIVCYECTGSECKKRD